MVVFSSLEFIFRFFLIFIIVYFITPEKYRRITLLIGSVIFYAVGEPVFILVLVLSTLINFFWGKRIYDACRMFQIRQWQEKKKKNILIQIVVFDAALLILFKLLGVFVSSELLPLGISFYIFKMISYQMDIYRGEISEQPSLMDTALYFTFFPQIVSGPIMRYEEGNLGYQPSFSWEKLEDGVKYFVIGLGLKVILADRLAILWNDIQMIGFDSISSPLAWLGAFSYSMQLYFDFWGYSLMAAGIGVMLGYDFIQNFDHPYASRSIGEFYRRWHMTLGSWFRDYIYIPMGGSRCSKSRLCLNIMVVWAITGLWHGSGLNYLIWGVILGLLILLEKRVIGKYLKEIPVIGHLYVLLLIPLTWVIFAIEKLPQLGAYFGRLFPLIGGAGIAVNSQDIWNYLHTYGGLLFAGVILCIPGVFGFYEKHKKNPIFAILLTGVFWYAVYYLVSSTGNPFMYFKF